MEMQKDNSLHDRAMLELSIAGLSEMCKSQYMINRGTSPGSCLPRGERSTVVAWQFLADKRTLYGRRLAVACREENPLRSSPGSCLPREELCAVVAWQLLDKK